MIEQPGPPDKKGGDKGRGNGSTDTGLQDTAILLARISGIGWFVVGSIGAGLGVGWLLDKQFGTEPVLLLIGLVIGVIAAFAGMIRLLSSIGRKRKKR